jgi:DUF4097 and DUF4098 domain-containing protein YvlB
VTLEALLLSVVATAAPSPAPVPAVAAIASVDTIIPVSASAQLRLDASAGRVTIRVWDRSAVRIVAAPVTGTTVRFETTSSLLSVRGDAAGGVDEADYEITIPRRMPVTVASGDLAIDVAGCEGDVDLRNHSGDISVAGSRGRLTVRSVLGEISVRDSRGRVSAQTQFGPIRLSDVVGEVEAEGSAGHIHLTRVDARALSATTVAGVIWFSGPLHRDGRYAFHTHSGSVFLTVPEPVDATLHVSTVSGAFATPFPMTRADGPRRGRFTVTFGGGAASVDVATFNGGIVVRPPDG